MKKIILMIGISFSHALLSMNIMDIAGPAFIGIGGIIIYKVARETQKIGKEQNDTETLHAWHSKKIQDIGTAIEVHKAVRQEDSNPLLRIMRDTPNDMLQTLNEYELELAQERIKLLDRQIRIAENKRLLDLSMYFLATGSLLCLKTAVKFFYDYEGK